MSEVPRYLFYVPVLHTQREARSIAFSVSGKFSEVQWHERPAEPEKTIQEMWNGISKKILELKLSSPSVRIYQDALPVCGIESEIVIKLAHKGSPNHQLIQELMKKGAHLEGTEDPELLIEENDYLMQLFADHSSIHTNFSLKKYHDKSMQLLAKRDAFIADRIISTTKPGEIPLVFMGVKHQLEKLLKSHFVIQYIIYRLPFKNVKEIYNV